MAKISKALASFGKDFEADPPDDAERVGSYGATVRDRWHGESFDIADGEHQVGDWSYTFAGGRFVSAHRTNS